MSVRTACAALAAASLLTLFGRHPVSAEPLHAGIAVADITPPLGYRMSGYFHERLATGVRNPLHAKALVLRQGEQRAALVFCDLIGLPLQLTTQVRREASEKTGIPEANILVAATHTHTGPLYCGALRQHFHDLAVAEHGSDPREKVDYPAQLAGNLVEAIAQANDALRAVRLEAGTTKQEGLAFNRRFHMDDGSVRFNPGVGNPHIVRAAGPTDPQVGILLFRDAADGQPLAVLVNFALHLDTVGGTEYAADYPYFLERALREKLGEDLVVLFGTGTCGDINHIDVTKKERLATETIGTTLAATVAETVPELSPVEPPTLAVRSETVHAPLQTYSDEQLAQARRDIHKVGTRELSFLDQVRAYKVLALAQRGGETIPLETQVFRFGKEVALVGLPGEVFVELGLAIQRDSPFATTLVVELCNDAPGYIPTAKAFAEGSYETVNSRIAPGGGEKLVGAAAGLLKELGGETP
ncbi:MAG: neutral/alkaline non-lysosomal ceramidase N-terminal domain-containing protein [Candidatus Brocadiia bacterium]